MTRFIVASSILLLLAPLCAQSPDALRIRAQQYVLQRTPDGEWLLELTGGVSMEFQGRSLQGERFLLDTAEARARSDAPFRLTTEVGVLSGQRVDYLYEQQRGRFEGVQAQVLGIYLNAALLEGDLDNFVAREVVVSTCDPLRPPIRVQARSVRLIEGARLTLRNARLFLYGQPILLLPQLTVRVRETAEIVSLPSPVYSAETGWGARLRLEIPVGERALVQASLIRYLQAIPETRVVVGAALSAGEPIVGEPELRLRFEQSALSNLREQLERAPPPHGLTLRAEYAADIRPLLAPRAGMRISKREIGLLAPLRLRNGYGEASLRYGWLSERIDNQRTPTRERTSVESDWFQPLARMGDVTLRMHLWASYAHYSGAGNSQWLRSQIELLWEPHPTLSILMGYARATTRGNSPFLTEQLRARHELSFRAEYQHGNLRLGTLLKYDLEQHDLYDVQLLLGWRDRCLEPYLFWRRSPSNLLIGVNLTAREF